MSCDPSKTCQICDQTGLPILPLRYAVARTGEGVKECSPPLQAPFGDGVSDIALPADQAHYTLRMLRAGFLYVFNEVRGEWKAYVVNDDAYLLEFDIHTKSPPDIADAQPCSRMQQSAAGRCIMVPDAARAGALWLGYSATPWTAAILERHRNEAYRKRHMQRVDVGAWAASGAAKPHMDALQRVSELVGEFALPAPEIISHTAEEIAAHEAANAAKPEDERAVLLPTVTIKPYPALDFSLTGYGNKQRGAATLLAAAQATARDFTPAMVAVNDPTGVSMDLATLMTVRLQDFMARPDLRHPLATSTLLQSLETAIRDQGELARIKAEQSAEVRELMYWRNIPMYSGGIGMADPNRVRMEQRHHDRMRSDVAYRKEWNAKVAEAKQRAADRLSAEDLAEAAEDSWDRYRDQLRDGQPQSWLDATYKPALQDLDKRCIVPLAKAHKAWLLSTPLLEYFDCNHDEADPRSGEGFANTVLLCIQDTQQNKISFDLYSDWLNATTITRSNLLLRAMNYNQARIIDAINAAVGGGLRPAALPDVPWDNLIGMYDKAETQLSQNGNAAARVVVASAGPLFKALDAQLNRAGGLLVSMGVMGKAPIVHVRHLGTVSEAIDTFVRMVQKTNPVFANVDRDLMRQHFEVRSRGLRQTRQTRNAAGQWAASDVQIRLDRFQLGQISEDVMRRSPSAALDMASDAILRMDEWPDNAMARWKTLMSSSLKLGFIQAILQVFALRSLGSELDKAAPQERGEAQWRYGAATMGAIGGVMELTETAIANSYKVGGSLGRMGGLLRGVLTVGSRLFGLGAAMVVAFVDGKQAYKEAVVDGDWGMAGLYGVSAVSGLGSALLLTGWISGAFLGLAATGWGLILLAVFLAVGFLISYFKEDKLQEWMEQCWFGEAKAFGDLEAELKAFEVATKPANENKSNNDNADNAYSRDAASQAG